VQERLGSKQSDVVLQGVVVLTSSRSISLVDFILLDKSLGLKSHIFRLNEQGVFLGVSKVGQGQETFFLSSLEHEPSRTVWQEERSDAEDDGGHQLEGQG